MNDLTHLLYILESLSHKMAILLQMSQIPDNNFHFPNEMAQEFQIPKKLNAKISLISFAFFQKTS